MKAMVLETPETPLELQEIADPVPSEGQIRLRVLACGVCRTDLHVVDSELKKPKLPLILGHEIVGEILEIGEAVEGFQEGERIGVPWLGWTCGVCEFCRQGLENLCDEARFTGYTLDGGYAEQTVADHRFCIPVSSSYDPAQAAPLLCAGLIGYRSLSKCGDARRIGFYGFGAAAHIIAQVARHRGQEIYAFTRPGDKAGQEFALSKGAVWSGDSDRPSPVPLDAAIIFAPVGELVPAALRSLKKGGRVVCGGIHMSDIPSFPYELLWEEREIVSVANLTREDGLEFMRVAPEEPVTTSIERFELAEANKALDRLREGRIEGAAVLIP